MFVVPQRFSVRSLRKMLLPGQNLVRDHRPRYRQQRQNRYDRYGFHGVNVVADCGRKRQSLAHFHDEGGKLSWPAERAAAEIEPVASWFENALSLATRVCHVIWEFRPHTKPLTSSSRNIARDASRRMKPAVAISAVSPRASFMDCRRRRSSRDACQRRRRNHQGISAWSSAARSKRERRSAPR